MKLHKKMYLSPTCHGLLEQEAQRSAKEFEEADIKQTESLINPQRKTKTYNHIKRHLDRTKKL